MTTVGILGAGAWGTALAVTAARAGHDIVLCGRDAPAMAALARSRENPRLPGVELPPAIRPTAAPSTLAEADLLLIAVPAQALRHALTDAAPTIRPGISLVLCAKGIERESGLRMSEIARRLLRDNPAAALSGPSFAADVGRGLPTAVTLAAESAERAAAIAAWLATPGFRLYHTDDLVGVEIGGAVKNVLAIACGIAQGRGLGASAVAALTARGFAELTRFGRASGARAETLMGLSGFGDLVLTCGSAQSRNFSLGLALGSGDPGRSTDSRLAEGVATAPILLAKAEQLGVAMPIVAAVAAVLAGEAEVAEVIDSLLARPIREEGLDDALPPGGRTS